MKIEFDYLLALLKAINEGKHGTLGEDDRTVFHLTILKDNKFIKVTPKGKWALLTGRF
jgi:hypothetical protein